jgi:Gamma-glutamyl phosphate reductase
MNNHEEILSLGSKAKKASALLSLITNEQKNAALEELKTNLNLYSDEIIKENAKDIKNAKTNNLSSALIDRLTLNKERIDGIIYSLDEIIKLKDPIGKIISEWNRPNGLNIQKISIPIGVIGFIYESRPNVTVDASAIAIKSGNAIILRGGKDSFYSSQKLKQIIVLSISKAGLPNNAIQMISSTDRSAVDEMLSLNQYIDVIIPRGG